MAALDGLLAREDLAAEVRLDARILRSQALLALGETKKAEAEWAAILDERPGFRPDPAAVPAKAIQRFEALRAAKVGTVRLELEPPDARLLLDGRPVAREEDGTVSVLAGTHLLRAERSGFDPVEATLAVGAGGSVDLALRLTPNARTVVLEAEPAGVEVLLDGEPVGRTAPPAEGGLPALVLADVPLGEHAFELRLACHRPLGLTELLAVDLVDRSPLRLGPFRLESARGTLRISGLPGATLRVDGTEAGALPLAAAPACAGPRRLEAVRSGRRVWSGTVDVPDGGEADLALAPRPNLVVVGEEAPPWAGSFSVEHLEVPAGFDPASAASWRALALPEDADLVWSPGGAWSPWLQASATLGPQPLLTAPPPRARASFGIGLAEGGPWGKARIVRLREGGPAARAEVRLGERLVAIGDAPVKGALEALATLAAAEGPVELTLAGGPDGERRVRLAPEQSPRLLPPPKTPAEAALRAAWAAADSAADPDGSAAAADLALALLAGGRAAEAATHWRALPWPARAGIGEGTAAYFLGRALAAAGDEEAASAALARAAASRATAESDDGPPLAPAARSKP